MGEQKNKLTLAEKIPSAEYLVEKRFSFINDSVLRVNVALAFQYIVFLMAVTDQEKTGKTTVGKTIHKSMIIYTASIIEGCLHHCLKRYIAEGKVDKEKVLGFEWKIKNEKKLKQISDEEYVFGAIRCKKVCKYSDKLHLKDLLKACHQAGILTKTLFTKADDIREKRNKIHLAGLGIEDDVYAKADVQAVFDNASFILKRVELMIARL